MSLSLGRHAILYFHCIFYIKLAGSYKWLA